MTAVLILLLVVPPIPSPRFSILYRATNLHIHFRLDKPVIPCYNVLCLLLTARPSVPTSLPPPSVLAFVGVGLQPRDFLRPSQLLPHSFHSFAKIVKT